MWYATDLTDDVESPGAGRWGLWTALAVWVLAALVSGPATAAPGAPLPGAAAIEDLEVWDDLVLEVDGVEVRAEIRYSPREVTWLVSAAALETPLLVSRRGNSVQRVAADKLERGRGLRSALLAGAALGYVGEYREERGAMSFEVDGHGIRLLPRPPLLGSGSAADVKKRHGRYAVKSEEHQPRRAVDPARFARARGAAVVVRVYFGSWSKPSERMVPKILRLEADLQGRVRFEYVGVSKPLTHDPLARESNVYSLPTAVVLVDGEEVERLHGRPLDTPEEALYEALIRHGL